MAQTTSVEREVKRRLDAHYRRKNRAHIRECEKYRRLGDPKWWLKLAFVKAGGSPLDWPIHRNPNA